MLKLRSEQRALLADKLADAANVALGALTFGQSLSGRATSLGVAFVGVALWIVIVAWAVKIGCRRENMITNILIMWGGVALFATIIGIMDWLAQRQERRSHKS